MYTDNVTNLLQKCNIINIDKRKCIVYYIKKDKGKNFNFFIFILKFEVCIKTNKG